jgi:hypothetical protein
MEMNQVRRVENYANRPIEPAIGDDRRGEIRRGEQLKADPEERRQHGGSYEVAPWHPSGQEKGHCPPEEGGRARVSDQSLGHGAACSMDSLADDALADQDPEQDASPGEESESVSPSAMLLLEDLLVDHLKGAATAMVPAAARIRAMTIGAAEWAGEDRKR